MKTNTLRFIKWAPILTVLLLSSSMLYAQFNYDIYVYDIKKGKTRQVSSIANQGEYNSSWSPNGKMITHEAVGYNATEDLWYQNIFVTDVESGESTPVKGGENGNDATWSPDGKRIMFDVWWWYIYSVPAHGGEPTLLREAAISGDWSPNSERIVFVDLNTYGIKTMNLKDKSETSVYCCGDNPAWSPNGQYIAFMDWSPGYYDGIWIIKVDKNGNPLGAPKQLTTSGSQPSWSNNSKTIIYSDFTANDPGNIYSVSIYGGLPVKVCGFDNPDFGDYDPCYSNNGQYIAFSGATLPDDENHCKSQLVATPGNLQVKDNFKINVLGNPSKSDFNLNFNSSSPESISLRIMDVKGKVVFNQTGIQPNSELKVGNDFSKGFYFVEVRQGNQRKEVKLIKN